MNALMYVVVIILMVGSVEVSAGTTTPGTIMVAITYDPASQWYSDACNAFPEHFQRYCFMEKGQGNS